MGECVEVATRTVIGDPVELGRQPVLECGQVAVPAGEAAMLDQRPTEVLGGPSGQLVEGGRVQGDLTGGC